MMSRLDEIIELLKYRENHFPRPFMEDLVKWLSTLSDKEVVEIMRIAATELAWRTITNEGGLHPSREVFYESVERIAQIFYEETKERKNEQHSA